MTFKTLMMGTAIAAMAATPALADDHKMKTSMTDTATTMATMDFDAYDMDRNDRVEFKEYYKYAKKEGVSATLAAQRFNKMTNGQYYLDRNRFQTAMNMEAAYYDNQVINSAVVRQPSTMVLDSTSTMSAVDPLNSTSPVNTYDRFDPTGDMMDGEMNTGTSINMNTDMKMKGTEKTYNYVSGNSGAYASDGTTVTNTMGTATTQPLYRPEDQVGGDLTQTENPMMQVRPDTMGTTMDYQKDIDLNLDDSLDESVDGDAGMGATYSDFREYEVGDTDND